MIAECPWLADTSQGQMAGISSVGANDWSCYYGWAVICSMGPEISRDIVFQNKWKTKPKWDFICSKPNTYRNTVNGVLIYPWHLTRFQSCRNPWRNTSLGWRIMHLNSFCTWDLSLMWPVYARNFKWIKYQLHPMNTEVRHFILAFYNH